MAGPTAPSGRNSPQEQDGSGRVGAGCIAIAALLLLAIIGLLGGQTEGAQKKRPKVDAERGMKMLWEGYEEPKEELTKQHPEPEAKKVIRLTGDAAPVTLSGFHSCGKFFDETVRPPFEAKVPYCDDRWESGWVQAATRAEGEVKLELLVDGQVQQTASLSNKRRLESAEDTEDLILRTPKATPPPEDPTTPVDPNLAEIYVYGANMEEGGGDYWVEWSDDTGSVKTPRKRGMLPNEDKHRYRVDVSAAPADGLNSLQVTASKRTDWEGDLQLLLKVGGEWRDCYGTDSPYFAASVIDVSWTVGSKETSPVCQSHFWFD